jgi:glycine hydroxymethyltransferase
LAAFLSILKTGDRIMGLELSSGGHLSHGHYSNKKKINISSIVFESLPYSLDENGYIDYDGLEKMSKIFGPKLIIAGGSAYPRDWDYKRMRKIADDVDAYLLCDMSHFAGLGKTFSLKIILVAAKELNSKLKHDFNKRSI